MSIRVILADDHRMMREGLKGLLTREGDIEVVAEAATGREAVRLVCQHAPDLVIMDVSMPDLNGIDAARQIRSAAPCVKIIALSMHSDRRFVARMFKAGAGGYLLKDCAYADLVKAIREVIADRLYLCPAIHDGPVEAFVGRLAQEDPAPVSVLTAREREVLQLLAEGHVTKEVARRLHVSAKTIETHRLHITEKLGMHTIAELTKFAIREGLTTVGE